MKIVEHIEQTKKKLVIVEMSSGYLRAFVSILDVSLVNQIKRTYDDTRKTSLWVTVVKAYIQKSKLL